MNPDQIRARIRELLDQRATHEQTVQQLRDAVGDGQPTPEQATALRAARDSIVQVDGELDQAQAALREALDAETRDANAARLRAELGNGGGDDQQQRVGGARVGREERTYTREHDRRGERSFFVDAFRATTMGDVSAMDRLRRHDAEVRVEGEMTSRAVGTSSFGGLVVPQYLVGLAARAMQRGRVLANIVAPLPLPESGMTLSIPRQTGSATVASQATENSALSNTDQTWSDLNISVATIGGQQDVSRQSLERGMAGIDQMIYADLAAMYHAELNRQVAQGSGASGQMLGILNTAGISTATAFGGAVTGAALNTKIAGAVSAVGAVGMGVAPTAIVMHHRRWGYLLSLSDSTGRPLVTPNAGAAMNPLGVNSTPGVGSSGETPDNFRQAIPVGSMQGLPVYTDANIPTNVGTNAEDVILVLDNDQALLWEEGDGMPRQLRFEQTLGQNLTVKMIAYGYAAFTAGRRAAAVARVGGADTAAGAGLITPTF